MVIWEKHLYENMSAFNYNKAKLYKWNVVLKNRWKKDVILMK